MSSEILWIEPAELRFPFEIRKQISCSVQLVNRTDSYVAFKVKTTSPKKYCVRPNTGVVLPGSTCDINVTMQAQREAPPDMQCKDKFLVQSVILPDDIKDKEVSQEFFIKAPGREVYETKLRVVFVSPPQPPSPVAESAEEGISPVPSMNLENGFDMGNDSYDLKEKLTLVASQIQTLMMENKASVQKNQALQVQTELKKLSAENNTNMPTTEHGVSFMIVLFVALLGILIGYFLHS